VNGNNWPAVLLFNQGYGPGSFQLQFYDVAAIQPNVTDNLFPNGASVLLNSLPFAYNTAV
jgi:hypothetical protein